MVSKKNTKKNVKRKTLKSKKSRRVPLRKSKRSTKVGKRVNKKYQKGGVGPGSRFGKLGERVNPSAAGAAGTSLNFDSWVGSKFLSDNIEYNKRKKFKDCVIKNKYFGVTSSDFTDYLHDTKPSPSYEQAKNKLIEMIRRKYINNREEGEEYIETLNEQTD